MTKLEQVEQILQEYADNKEELNRRYLAKLIREVYTGICPDCDAQKENYKQEMGRDCKEEHGIVRGESNDARISKTL